MPPAVTRIFSDLHFGDRASRARRLGQLRPLLDGVDRLVLNGDSLDTRPGPAPEFTAALRVEVAEFFAREVPAVTFVTGNHDADFSTVHSLDLAGGQVFAVHGDILFDSIVPWGKDAARVTQLLAEERATLPPGAEDDLVVQLALWRRVAVRLPQRHQSERRRLKYAVGFVGDTFWPPLRILRILRAWQEEPKLAAAFLRRHRPAARFLLLGHTHRPRWWQVPDGPVIVNTGSFCAPLGGFAVDLMADRLLVRRVRLRGGEFHPGRTVAEFPLAGT